MSGGANNRILDIVFVLDTTWSMDERDASGLSIIDRMNALVEKLMREIIADSRSSEVTEIAFLTFADDITMETDFRDPLEFEESDFVPMRRNQKVELVQKSMEDYLGDSYPALVPRFCSVGESTSSRIGRAVIYAINKIMNERKRQTELHPAENIQFFVPIIILITDGAPKNKLGQMTMIPEEEKKAIDLTKAHCQSIGNASNLIYPVICGIGDEQVERHLKQYSAGYLDGFQHIRKVDQSKGFEELFKKIGLSITGSFSLNDMESFSRCSQAAAESGEATKRGTETYRLNNEEKAEDEI